MDRILLRVDEAAIALGLGRSQVYRMAAGGILPTVRFGRSVRIPAAALRDWIADHVREGIKSTACVTAVAEGEADGTG